MKKLYKRNIDLFYLFTFVGEIELTIAIFVLFFLANNLTMTQVMILEAIYTVAILCLEVPSGAFADLYGRKFSVALSAFFAALGFVIFGLGSTFFVFLIGQIAIALALSFRSGADSALIYDTLKKLNREREYTKIFGKIYSMRLWIMGSLSFISGTLATFWGYRALFFISAGFFFVSFIIALFFKEPPVHKHVRQTNYFRHLRSAVKVSFERKRIRHIIIYYGLFAAMGHLAYFILQPFYSLSGLSEIWLGVGIGIYFISAGLGTYYADFFINRSSQKKLKNQLLIISALSFCLMFINPILALVFIFIMSFACGVRDLFIEGIIHKNTESYRRATVISVQSMSKSVMYLLAAPMLGVVTDIYSPSATLFLMGFTLFVFYVVLKIRNI